MRLVTEEDGLDETDYLDEDDLSPFLATEIEHRQTLVKQRKTVRQLESNEARLRIFGDMCDVPHGYKKVDGPDGPRLVPLVRMGYFKVTYL